MGKGTTKNLLLEEGRRLFLERGYTNSGIEAILSSAGVPKGSFYYYFESKEDFGLQVLDRFAESYGSELEQFLGDENYAPLDRLRRMVESKCERIEREQCRNGCMVGNLSTELASQSEAFRSRLDAIFRGWSDRIARCLREAQAAGDVPDHLDAGELAAFWLNSWQGAVLRAKTLRTTAPLRTFQNVMFGFVLQGQGAEAGGRSR